MAILLLTVAARASDLAAGFEAANKLYEQGKFPEAAGTYEKLLQSGPPSDTLYFNLGNAWFKAGQIGRAIAAYRQAERLAPRDPSVRFNLQFARKKVTGSDAPPGLLWQRALVALTLNEWTVLASAALWVWFALLAVREIRPTLRQTLRGYTATAGVVLLLLSICLGGAAQLQFKTRAAVVVIPDAIVRSGPLDEAKVLQQLRDGVEVTVLDDKEVITPTGKQSWLQVRDSAGRTGWMKSDQLVVLNGLRKQS
jgi:tetratricopeptide (TPR) repeat protein